MWIVHKLKNCMAWVKNRKKSREVWSTGAKKLIGKKYATRADMVAYLTRDE